MQADSSVADLMPALVLVAVDTNLHTNRTEECKRAARGSGVLGGAPEAKGLLWVGFRPSASSPDVRFLQRNGSQLWTKSMLSRSPENHGTKACSSDRKRPLSSKKSGRCEFDCRSPAILGISLSLTWRIDSKLRACDLVKLRARDVCHGDRVAARTIVMQQKTQRSVQFEITEPTREAIAPGSTVPVFDPRTISSQAGCMAHSIFLPVSTPARCRSPTRNTPQPRAFRGTGAKESPILQHCRAQGIARRCRNVRRSDHRRAHARNVRNRIDSRSAQHPQGVAARAGERLSGRGGSGPGTGVRRRPDPPQAAAGDRSFHLPRAGAGAPLGTTARQPLPRGHISRATKLK